VQLESESKQPFTDPSKGPNTSTGRKTKIDHILTFRYMQRPSPPERADLLSEHLIRCRKKPRRTSHDKNKLTYPPELAPLVSVEAYGGPEFA
jgi:hypothetical protein